MAQEGRKKKPIPPTTPSRFTDRKTSRTNLTGLKPGEDVFFVSFPPKFLLLFCPFFLFLLPSILYHFYSFFLPSFIYSFILIFVKIPSYLAFNLFYSFFLPSLPFLFLFSLLPFFFSSPPHFLSFFPQVRQENLEC